MLDLRVDVFLVFDLLVLLVFYMCLGGFLSLWIWEWLTFGSLLFKLDILMSDFRFGGILELLDFEMVDFLDVVCCWTC